MNNFDAWQIDDKWVIKAKEIEASLQDVFAGIDEIREYNQLKVLKSLQKVRFSDAAFASTTGYGYDDKGRELLEAMYADVFGTEVALVRPQLASGTQALAIALGGILRPGDELLAVTGSPYDTLKQVIGLDDDPEADNDNESAGNKNVGNKKVTEANEPERELIGSLREFNISYNQVDLLDNKIDVEGILKAIKPQTKIVMFQRSRGYSLRKSLSVYEMEKAFRIIKAKYPQICCLVDNCYGEFTEKDEPTAVGADICIGSLIKNPGGGLASTGAYIVGKQKYVDLAANRLYAPGLGRHVGPMLNQTRDFVQGFYMSPHVVGESLKGLAFAAAIFADFGFITAPAATDRRFDIIQTITFNKREPMLKFCQAVQAASPIDSFVTPEPWAMPGYDCEVIMAAGAFVQGASIELSADGPVKPPYTVFMQGGLVYENVKLAALLACQRIS